MGEEVLELMRLIDCGHLEYPYNGSRRIRDWLKDEGWRVNRKHIQRLMRTMGLVVLYPNRDLSASDRLSMHLTQCNRM
jgi:putative transposase